MAEPQKGGSAKPPPPPTIDDQGKDNAARQAANVEAVKTDQAMADPLMPKDGMNAGQVMAASPNHLIVPDPLPPLNRAIVDPPPMGNGHPPLPLHPHQPPPVIEAAVEELRVRLGEMREFLKRFTHDVGGDMGSLVDHLRVALVVPRSDPIREEDRRIEDANIAVRRRQEDIANGSPPSAAQIAAREREDAGLAAFRRIQDTPV